MIAADTVAENPIRRQRNQGNGFTGLLSSLLVALCVVVIVAGFDNSQLPVSRNWIISGLMVLIVLLSILPVLSYKLKNGELKYGYSKMQRENDRLSFQSIKASNLLLVRCDPDGRITELNEYTENFFGYPAKELIGLPLIGTLIPEIDATGRNQRSVLEGLLIDPPQNQRIDCECKKHDGSKAWISWEQIFRFDNRGVLLDFLSIGHNITRHKKTEKKLRVMSSVFDKNAEGVIVTSLEGRILHVNRTFLEITQLNREMVIGEKLTAIGIGAENTAFFDELWSSLVDAGCWHGEIWNRRQSGDLYPAKLRLESVQNKSGNTAHYVGFLSDITDQKLSEQRIQQLVFFDNLTQLPNRALLLDRLSHSIDRARREVLHVPLIYIDLNRFKEINDSLGHDMGDLLLKLLARRLRSCIRSADTLSRMGADEFAVIVDSVSNRNEIIRVTTRIVQSILDATTKPFDLDGYEAFISLNIGIVSFPEDGLNPMELLNNADTAVNHARQRGPNHYLFYEQKMNATAMKRMQMATGLHKAFEKNEFVLHYQPTLNLNTGKINGCEALVRWQHPSMGIIRPLQFIPLAEETGLILSLGEWVFAEAIRQTKEWQSQGIDSLRIAINLSLYNLRQKDLLRFVHRMLEVIRLAPEFIALELTESAFMDDAEDMIAILNELDKTGIQLMIDDFGTGYSSFSRLRELPAHTLKIDRSFMCGIPENRANSNLVSAMIAMAHNLGMKVIAEGIETEEQMAFMMEQHCDEAQGYLIGKPVPAAEFTQLIQNSRD